MLTADEASDCGQNEAKQARQQIEVLGSVLQKKINISAKILKNQRTLPSGGKKKKKKRTWTTELQQEISPVLQSLVV